MAGIDKFLPAGSKRVRITDIISKERLDKISDVLTGQDPTKIKPFSLENQTENEDFSTTQTHTQVLLGKLLNLWLQKEDGLDVTIIDTFKEIAVNQQDTSKELLSRYTLLVKKSQEDFTVLKDMLIESARAGYQPLYWSIKSSLCSYQAGISNAIVAITDKANSATELATITTQTLDQTAKMRNTLTASMASFMEALDTKMLAMSGPSTSKHLSPLSTDSRSTSDPRIKLEPGHQYKCELGILDIDIHNNYYFSSNGSFGTQIHQFGKLGIPWPTFKRFMKLDLKELSKYLGRNREIILEYSRMTKEGKRDILQKIITDVPKGMSTWVKI